MQKTVYAGRQPTNDHGSCLIGLAPPKVQELAETLSKKTQGINFSLAAGEYLRPSF